MNCFSDFLVGYQRELDVALAKSIASFGPPTQLRRAIEYALKNGGKRFRPTLIYLINDAIGKGQCVSDVALAVEYFHIASLIADDLPCMDNDEMRRNQPSVHKVFGESTAILATYALIAAGYDRIRLNAQKHNKETLILLAIENVSFNTGILGATGGQFGDLFPLELNEATVLDVIDKKTGTLFQISFVLGWLFGGGDLQELEWVKKAACHFGRAFQISDDFIDLQQDVGKLNFPSIVGVKKAICVLSEELENIREALKKLRLDSPELLSLITAIEQRTA